MASMPSAGVMGSRTSSVSERAIPTSDHWPQLIAVAGRPDARRHATRASTHAFAHAYAACPGEPSSEATEEKPTHQSRFRVAVTSCSRKAPAALGAHTRSRLSVLRAATRPSSRTAAACTTPRNGSPVSSAAVTSCSATPGEAMSPSHEDDFGAAFEVGKAPPLLVGGTGPAVENDASGAAVDEPARDDHAQPAETAGDDVRAVRTDNRVTLAFAQCRAREPFDVSVLPPPGDHVIATRRLQFRQHCRDHVVRRVHVHQSGAKVRVLIGEDPDEALESADRRIPDSSP